MQRDVGGQKPERSAKNKRARARAHERQHPHHSEEQQETHRRHPRPQVLPHHNHVAVVWAAPVHPQHHPVDGRPLDVELVEFYEQTAPHRNVVIFGDGQVDRSPCGTGTSAKMAFLHARGKLKIGEEYRYQSILDTEFVGKITAETLVGDHQAIVPEVTGSAYITGLNTLVLAEGDPFPCGFALNSEGQEEDLLPHLKMYTNDLRCLT